MSVPKPSAMPASENEKDGSAVRRPRDRRFAMNAGFAHPLRP